MVTNNNSINVEGDATFTLSFPNDTQLVYTGHAHLWGDNNQLNATVSFNGADPNGNTLVFEANGNKNNPAQHSRVDCN